MMQFLQNGHAIFLKYQGVLLRVAKIVFAIFLAFFIFRAAWYHYRLVTYPYPIEYREAAVMVTTADFLDGKNPFSLEAQPAHTNDYGVLYPLIVYPLAKIFGPTLFIHRAVTAFFIWASMLLLFVAMRRMAVPFLLNVSALLIFYGAQLYPETTTPGAHPATTGIFLLLMTIFWPWLRGFSGRSLLVSAVCGVLAFYAKPYFLIAGPILGSYVFFFVSKKKGLAYTGIFALLAAISAGIVQYLWPYYFTNCLILHLNCGHLYLDHFIKQITVYAQLHTPFSWALGIAFCLWLWAFITGEKKSFVWPKIYLTRFTQPLFTLSVSLPVYAWACCLYVLCTRLAWHNAAWLWYFFHLSTPFLVIIVVSIFGRHKFWPFLFTFPMVMTIFTFAGGLNFQTFDQNAKEWKIVKELISTHQNILNSSLIAPLLVEQHKRVYDNGLSEYSKMGGYREQPWLAKISKPDGKLILRHYAFINEVAQMIKNKQFDLVIITKDYSPMVPGELTQYYRCVEEIRVAGFPQTVWRPK